MGAAQPTLDRFVICGHCFEELAETCWGKREEGGQYMSEENKALAREAIRIWTTGDFDAADEIFSPDYVNHQHHHPSDKISTAGRP